MAPRRHSPEVRIVLEKPAGVGAGRVPLRLRFSRVRLVPALLARFLPLFRTRLEISDAGIRGLDRAAHRNAARGLGAPPGARLGALPPRGRETVRAGAIPRTRVHLRDLPSALS